MSAPRHPGTPVTGTPLPPDAGVATRVSLLAAVTLLALDALRAAGPVLDRAGALGAVPAALVALATFAGAGVPAALVLLGTGRRVPGTASGRTALAAVVAVGVARLVTQAVRDEARFAAGLVTTALAVAALVLVATLVAGRPGGGRQAAVGLALGTGLSAALQVALGTWDPLWHGGVVGTVVAVALVALPVVLAAVARGHEPAGRPRRTWALGPALALLLTVLANPAFAASQSDVPLPLAGSALVLASAGTVWLLLVPRIMVRPVRWGAAVLLPVSLAAALLLTGPPVLAAVVLAQVAAGVVLAVALKTRRSAPPGVPRTALATAGVGLGLVAVPLVHLLGHEVPLPVDDAWVVVLAATLLAAAGLRWRTPVPAERQEPAPPLRANALRFLVLPSVALLAVGWWQTALVAPAPAVDREPGTFVVLDWNLHHGVAADTAVDLERIARTIEAEAPDVVALQEVARGWVLGGGVDMATWLGDRLGMHVAFAPAADRQLGNALLSREPLTDVEEIALPTGAGPQQRSALTAVVPGPHATPVRVTSVHLQHRAANTPTRLDQLAALAAALPDDGPSVLAGDLDTGPGSPEAVALLDAGWVSAVDEAGDPDAGTFPSSDPGERVDWVLGRGVVFSDARVLADPSSDHLPVVATVRLGG
jgi:endonuclease/exonuclease/phosphatase family metal-dependent hydrolase